MSEQPANAVTWTQWRWVAVLMTAGLAILEFQVYRSLAPVERGEPGGAVWSPIAIVYELFGFAAALSVIPLLWVVLMTIATWQTWLRAK